MFLLKLISYLFALLNIVRTFGAVKKADKELEIQRIKDFDLKISKTCIILDI